MLGHRGIKPENLPPEEDIKKLECPGSSLMKKSWLHILQIARAMSVVIKLDVEFKV
jgi:hypothetical protein